MKNLLFKFLTAGIALLLALFAQVRPVVATDKRVLKLDKFLQAQHSPLASYSPDYVAQADKAGLDYRLLPAISGVESSFGQEYLPGTFNAYGWGGGLLYFSSFKDGIEKVLTSLKSNYVDRGAVTVEQIGYIYCPPNPINWAVKVRNYMAQIENTEITIPINLASKLPLTL